MQNKICVSIAMTTYNGETYIENQLKSIFSQTRQPDEIIICDDCSTDNTVAIIHDLIAKYGVEHLVRLVENRQNKGYIRNFHQAIGLCSGDFVFLADQDDEWYPSKLERLVDVMVQSGAEAICTGFDLIDKNGGLIEDAEKYVMDPIICKAGSGLTPITFSHLIFRNVAPGCTYCCTRRTAQAYLSIESQMLPHDYQIMFIGALLGNIYFLNEKTIAYRLHGRNTIGFSTKGTSQTVKLRRPKRKPTFVVFFDDVNRVVPIPHRQFYNLLYYLRVPYMVSLIKQKLNRS